MLDKNERVRELDVRTLRWLLEQAAGFVSTKARSRRAKHWTAAAAFIFLVRPTSQKLELHVGLPHSLRSPPLFRGVLPPATAVQLYKSPRIFGMTSSVTLLTNVAKQ